MVTIQTYLRIADGEFLGLGEAEFSPPDRRYVDGALVVAIDGTEIVGLEDWTDIVQLWAHIASMGVALESAEEASTYFPDVPILLKVARQGNRAAVTVHRGRESAVVLSCSAKALFGAIHEAGVSAQRLLRDSHGIDGPGHDRMESWHRLANDSMWT